MPIRILKSSHHLSDDIHKLLDRYKAEDVFRTCVSCVFFNHKEICDKANARPPAFVIVNGCDMFFDNEDIPF